ncbi:MAG: hypothetical protein IT210_04420 [Armatimonadetes bacterium]|nr:hypothetical protein [Armatimonadota bacterium]
MMRQLLVQWPLWIPLCLLAATGVVAASKDLGNGFMDHGVATPVSNHRGIVATKDGEGRNAVLCWLFDHTGGYALLMVDAETGKSESFPMPFPSGGDCPYASILSSANKYYTHFNSYFVEFDPAKRAFTFWEKTAPQMAMSMTEDDQGRIWSVTYPQSGLAVFDPKTRKLKDYGHVYTQNWPQYPRDIATDDAGWVYFGTGSTANQIIIFDPDTGKATALVPEDRRGHGSGVVYREMSGKVYGQTGGADPKWYLLYKGEATSIEPPEKLNLKPYIAGSQGLFHGVFPDGKLLREFDTVERRMVVENPASKESKTLAFDYASEGAHIMGVAVAPDNTICGGTAFPMRFFSFNPKTDTWVNREAYGQWNTVARGKDRFYAGGYGGGFLLEWDPAKPWVDTTVDDKRSNPLFLGKSEPTINRPHDLLVHPDGNTLVLAGTPGYGLTGGGLFFWDRASGKGTILTHTDLIPQHSTMSLVALPGGKLLGGTTTSPGTGGEKKASLAELYILDMASKKIEWHEAVLPEVGEYADLCPGPRGLVYGFAGTTRFFVFDPAKRKVVHQEDTMPVFGPTAYQQGPRIFVQGQRGVTFVLFQKGIARIDPRTFRLRLLVQSPVPVSFGGDYLDGRIYFGSGSHVYSWKVGR